MTAESNASRRARPVSSGCAKWSVGDTGLLTLRNPNGGFHRLRIVNDGHGVVAADGAEAATVAIAGTGQIEVAIGGDRYRLPATIRARGDAPDRGSANPHGGRDARREERVIAGGTSVVTLMERAGLRRWRRQVRRLSGGAETLILVRARQQRRRRLCRGARARCGGSAGPSGGGRGAARPKPPLRRGRAWSGEVVTLAEAEPATGDGRCTVRHRPDATTRPNDAGGGAVDCVPARASPLIGGPAERRRE